MIDHKILERKWPGGKVLRKKRMRKKSEKHKLALIAWIFRDHKQPEKTEATWD